MDKDFGHVSDNPIYKKSVMKISVFSLILSLVCAGLIIYVGTMYYYNLVVLSLSESATVFALQTANLVDTEQLELLIHYDDDDAWLELQTMFDVILTASVDFLYLYIIVPYDDERFMYVVSGNHYYLRHFVDDPEVYSEEAAWTTLRYGVLTTTPPDFYGVWGQMLSAFVPLKDRYDEIIAVLGADIDISVVRRQVFGFSLVLGTLSVVILLLLSLFLWLYSMSILRTFTKKLIESEQDRILSIKKSETKTRFLAKMSHEIRTPMNVILGLTELQLQKKNITREVKETFMQIFRSSKLLIGIINDILDYSKVELGKMEIVPKPYDLREVIAASLQLNKMFLGEKNIKFVLEIDENQYVKLVGDKLRMQQVLNNLLSNAFKYTVEGTVSMKVVCYKVQGKAEVLLSFIIKDTGCGMSKEQQELLFKNDYIRFAPQKETFVEGTGLGISIAYQLATLMKGSLEVESELGAGSVFTFYVRQKIHSDERLGANHAEKLRRLDFVSDDAEGVASINYQSLSHASVLVVDDLSSNIVVIREMLSMYEINVTSLYSGAEALEIVKAGKDFDIIFMDYMMPDLNGIETMHKLRELGYKKPIIVLTADITNNNEKVFIKEGFDGFLSKPVDVSELDKCLLRFIPAVKENNEPKPKYSKRLLDSFVKDVAKGLKNVNELMPGIGKNKESLEQYRINIHSLKSACANVGLMELSELAKGLEIAAIEKDTKELLAKTPAFLSMLGTTLDEYEAGVD